MIWSMIIELNQVFIGILKDVAPIVAVLLGFQMGILRRKIPHLRTVLFGLVYVVVGLTFFLFGLERALFPLGNEMARQLTDPVFLGGGPDIVLGWADY